MEGMQSESAVIATAPHPGHYDIDPSQSRVTFTTRHLFGLGRVKGSFAIRGGTAVPADVSQADPDGLRATLLEVYTPRYGAQWADFLDSGPVYARIEADRMYALDVTVAASQYSGDDQPRA